MRLQRGPSSDLFRFSIEQAMQNAVYIYTVTVSSFALHYMFFSKAAAAAIAAALCLQNYIHNRDSIRHK